MLSIGFLWWRENGTFVIWLIWWLLSVYFGSLYLLWSVFINPGCNKCGQTSRLAAGAQIQTSCNCEKDIYSYTCLWIVSLVGVPASTAIREDAHYTGTALCLAITIVAYSKMFFRLRHNQIHRIHPLQGESQAIQMNTARYRKAVYGALWVQAALVVCYLPLIVAIALIHQRGTHLSYYLACQFTSK